jgi:hypothetical protein
VDPLAAKYPYYSPYSFSGGRIIDSRELEGLEPVSSSSTEGALMGAYVGRLFFGGTTTSEDVLEIHSSRHDINSQKVHFMLDIAGTIPVIGEPADAINGAFYSLEGNHVDAALSFAGMVPFAGWASTGTKWARNILKFSDNAFHSASGLVFKQGRKHGNRLSHVLAHTADDMSKVKHGVFNSGGDELVGTLDEAWEIAQKGGDNVVKTVQDNGNVSYLIDMGKEIGYEGGKKGSGEALSKINIVVEEGTSDVITAFPTK